MTLRFASLGSGSRGNALLVESASTLLLVDCGLPRRSIEQRMKVLGRAPGDVTAILISHEHSDHCQGIGPFLRRYPTPTWLTAGTASAVSGLGPASTLNPHRALEIGSIKVVPYPVPHDAREPCQFVFQADNRRLGVLTDTGHITSHIRERLAGCDALAVEFNHDLGTLHRSAYPESLKARVASKYGHLNNDQSVNLLAEIQHGGLQWVMGLHLSEQNNSQPQVRDSAGPLLEQHGFDLHLAGQDEPSEWLDVN